MRRQHETKTRNSAPTLCCLKNSLGFQEAVKNNGRFTLNCGKRGFWFKPWIFVEYDYIRLKKQPVIRPSFPYHSMRRQQSPTRDYTNLRRVCKCTFEMANYAVQTSAMRWRLEALLLEKSLGFQDAAEQKRTRQIGLWQKCGIHTVEFCWVHIQQRDPPRKHTVTRSYNSNGSLKRPKKRRNALSLNWDQRLYV